MKMVFKVKIHLKDRSHNVYNVVAKDDIEARTKAETMEVQSFKELTNVPFEYLIFGYSAIEHIEPCEDEWWLEFEKTQKHVVDFGYMDHVVKG